MKTSARDKVLMMIMPTLIIVLFYGLYVGMNRQKLVTRLTADVVKAREQQPSQAKMQNLMRSQAEATRAMNAAQAELKSWEERWHALVAPCLAHERRSYRQSKLLTLLLEQNIHVKVHGPLQDSQDQKSAMKLSAAQERLVKLMTERGGQQSPHLWRLQVEGGYLDIARALHVLSSTSGDLVAIPLSLSMDGTKGNVRTWSILVWI